MILSILEHVREVVAVVIALVMLVERKGDGLAKRAEVIAGVKVAINALKIPDWIKGLMSLDVVLGALVDALVFALNKTGWFAAQGNPTPSGG